jgi:hypothetical protein
LATTNGKATDEEILRWIKSHDVFDRLQTGVSERLDDHGDLDELLPAFSA